MVNGRKGDTRRGPLAARTHCNGIVFGVIKKFGDDNAGTLVSNLAYSALLPFSPCCYWS
jgi:hypothetical protein